ncbi:Universal stress protein [Polyrhizophydium stewartii]|uniref:Universal stress protein n=1 Tax=Polyrhizophydium stewartii TaxID=2732419 RepID=A0ABR4N719_9FUNG
MSAHKNTILLPTDFSDAAAKALVWAARFVIHHDDRVVLLHTLEDVHEDDGAALTPEATQLYQGAERKLNEWAKELRRQLHGKHAFIETKVGFGAAGVATVKAADKIAPDMVLMAVHGQTGVASVEMGPVASYVCAYLKSCPVVLVRSAMAEEIAA